MSASHYLAALAAAVLLLAPIAGHATDDTIAASSSHPVALKACNNSDDDTLKSETCKPAGYDKLVAAINQAFAATLAKTPANIKPLLRRDEVWFDEIILAAGEDGLPDDFADTLRQRATTIADIGNGFGRPGYLGHWVNALGKLDVTATDGGYRVAIETLTVYGADDRRKYCEVTAQVKAGSDGWLSGTVLPGEDQPAAKATPAEVAKPVTIKIRRQGE